MNERIQELLLEAREQTKEGKWHAPTAVWAEKFAELIVRESASLSLDYRNHDHYIGWTDYREEIKRHFGVEE